MLVPNAESHANISLAVLKKFTIEEKLLTWNNRKQLEPKPMLFLSESVRRGRVEKEREAEEERKAGECKEELMTCTVHKS